VASGEIHYHRFEPTSDIDTLVSSDIVVIRYRSDIDGEFSGQPESVRCWHTDGYRRNADGWQVVWSQAITIDND
jgi:ketosteroid isomerase-like protein